MTDVVDAVVIGAGFAGLVAARDLGQNGLRVILLEARERIGGRTLYREFASTGRGVELGGAWFDAGYQTPMREEADRYGIEIVPATVYQNVRWFTGGQLRCGLPVDRWEGGDLERTLFEITLAARNLASNTAEERYRHDIPVSAWLEQLRPRPATRDFLYGWSSLMSGAHPDDYPMLPMLGLIAHHGSAYAFYADLKHVFATGTASLAEAIAADVRGDVRLETPVRAIRQSGDLVTVDTPSGAVSARICILAAPVNVMGQIAFDPPLDAERQQAVEIGGVCTMTKVWMLATGVPDRMLAAGWQTPFYWLAADHHVDDAQLVVAFALQGSVDVADLDALERALRVYAPEARVLAAESHDWVRDPWSLGGWMTDPPGWAAAGIFDRLARPHGRVLMAGSDVAPEFGGWIAGAIASGRATAHLATRQLAS